MNLTPKQLAIARIIRDTLIKRGFAPTYAELAHELGGRSKVTVFEHVQTMIKKGVLVNVNPRGNRGLRLGPDVSLPGDRPTNDDIVRTLHELEDWARELITYPEASQTAMEKLRARGKVIVDRLTAIRSQMA